MNTEQERDKMRQELLDRPKSREVGEVLARIASTRNDYLLGLRMWARCNMELTGQGLVADTVQRATGSVLGRLFGVPLLSVVPVFGKEYDVALMETSGRRPRKLIYSLSNFKSSVDSQYLGIFPDEVLDINGAYTYTAQFIAVRDAVKSVVRGDIKRQEIGATVSLLLGLAEPGELPDVAE